MRGEPHKFAFGESHSLTCCIFAFTRGICHGYTSKQVTWKKMLVCYFGSLFYSLNYFRHCLIVYVLSKRIFYPVSYINVTLGWVIWLKCISWDTYLILLDYIWGKNWKNFWRSFAFSCQDTLERSARCQSSWRPCTLIATHCKSSHLADGLSWSARLSPATSWPASLPRRGTKSRRRYDTVQGSKQGQKLRENCNSFEFNIL